MAQDSAQGPESRPGLLLSRLRDHQWLPVSCPEFRLLHTSPLTTTLAAISFHGCSLSSPPRKWLSFLGIQDAGGKPAGPGCTGHWCVTLRRSLVFSEP